MFELLYNFYVYVSHAPYFSDFKFLRNVFNIVFLGWRVGKNKKYY